MFGSFKNPFATITGLSKFYFRFRRFILLVEMKKVISMKYDRKIEIESNRKIITEFIRSISCTRKG